MCHVYVHTEKRSDATGVYAASPRLCYRPSTAVMSGDEACGVRCVRRASSGRSRAVSQGPQAGGKRTGGCMCLAPVACACAAAEGSPWRAGWRERAQSIRARGSRATLSTVGRTPSASPPPVGAGSALGGMSCRALAGETGENGVKQRTRFQIDIIQTHTHVADTTHLRTQMYSTQLTTNVQTPRHDALSGISCPRPRRAPRRSLHPRAARPAAGA